MGAQPSTGPSAFGARGLGTGCWEEGESSLLSAGWPTLLCICPCLARKPHKALLFGPCLRSTDLKSIYCFSPPSSSPKGGTKEVMLSGGGTSRAQQLGALAEWLQMDLQAWETPLPLRDTGSLPQGPTLCELGTPHPCPYPYHSPVSLQVHSLPERGREELRRHKLKRQDACLVTFLSPPLEPQIRCLPCSSAGMPQERDRARESRHRQQDQPGASASVALTLGSEKSPQLWRPCGPGPLGAGPSSPYLCSGSWSSSSRPAPRTHCSSCLLALAVSWAPPHPSFPSALGIWYSRLFLMLGLGPPSPPLPTPGHSIRSWTAANS